MEIDSVCHDFLMAEWLKVVTTGGGTANSLQGGAEDYLHEAALASDPPSTMFYDPNGTGVRLASLGVHEHWNNPTDKQYGRNLGLGEGIERVALRVSRPPVTLSCRREADRVVVSWDTAFEGFGLETTPALAPRVTWLPVTEPPALILGRNTVTNALSAPGQFYRLVK